MKTRTIKRLKPAVRSKLNSVKETIINTIPDWIEQIYLFGSYAYGVPHKYSDLDIYIVLKDDVPAREIDVGLQIVLAIEDQISVSIIAKKKVDFENRAGSITLEQKVFKEGILIYG